MYYLLTLLSALLVAIMVAINGSLTGIYGTYVATLIIHIFGLLTTSIIIFIRKEHVFSIPPVSPLILTGGVVGVGTVLFNNLAFGQISLSALIALSLLGQTISSLIIDQYGLFGMPIKKLNGGKLVGLICSTLGIIYLCYDTKILFIPIFVSLLSGVTIVLSRSVNAQLAEVTSSMVSTWYNYFTGIVTTIVLCGITAFLGYTSYPKEFVTTPWIYLGGILGAIIVLLTNISTKKMSAFYMTLILFIGQIAAGILIDTILYQAFSMRQLIGAIFALIGLSFNVWIDSIASKTSTRSN